MYLFSFLVIAHSGIQASPHTHANTRVSTHAHTREHTHTHAGVLYTRANPCRPPKHAIFFSYSKAFY